MRSDMTSLPEWMQEKAPYEPRRDHDGFITKSLLHFMRLFEAFRSGARPDGGGASADIKMLTALLLIVLMAISHRFVMTLVVAAVFLMFLAVQKLEILKKTMATGSAAAAVTMIIMLPALFMSHSSAFVTVTVRVFLSVALVTYVSGTTPWNRMTEAAARLHVPAGFVFLLNLTLQHISVLGRSAAQILEALKLRSVGRNETKVRSFSGVPGTLFLKSARHAEETQEAMTCRLFDGRMPGRRKLKMNGCDAVLLALDSAAVAFFIYLLS